MKGYIIGASLENCVHVAGVVNFLRLAEFEGYKTKFLGPAVSIESLIEVIKFEKPDVAAVSYRLSPQAALSVLNRLKERIEEEGIKVKWYFGGTKPVADIARDIGIFDRIFDGSEDLDDVIMFLREARSPGSIEIYPDNLIDRIWYKYPYPVLRHHFGMPSYEETLKGIEEIAESRVLDVISIAPDQNTQEFFFEPHKMKSDLDGAGGVPLRSKEDFIKLYESSRKGNYPLLRCYSGTNNLIKFAELLKETINNAWGAVPLCWYSVLDGRSKRSLKEAIEENQEAMKWHGENGIPLEVNEAHHWSLRDAHDTIGVTTAFLAAYNAKKAGVKHYIAQLMFNVPPSISYKMDLAKMLAKIELIESLEDDDFKVFRQVRAGLSSFPYNLDSAKGQLASSTFISMALKPHIVHVVGYCEAQYAAGSREVIESVNIVRNVIKNCLSGMPDFTRDEEIQRRKEELIEEAKYLLEAIKYISNAEDPWSDAETLAKAIKLGLLDAPHLKGNKEACGKLETRVINGACYAFDSEKKRVITERERVDRILSSIERIKLSYSKQRRAIK